MQPILTAGGNLMSLLRKESNMGHGYFILLWDGWGAGLVRINPRLYTEGVDMYGNPNNWWPCEEDTIAEEVISKHGLQDEKFIRVFIS